MSSYNPKALFDRIQAKEQELATNAGGSGFTNPLIFKPKVGTTYSVRLLWLQPDNGVDREYPMINSYVHRIWNENATGSKDVKVICPTSQYMMNETPAAFKKCPICSAASDFYKKGQEGSESAKDLYSKFRRTCMGYVPVYIVNGPEEEVGEIRILQYGKQFKDFFDSKIFGRTKTKNNDKYEVTIDEEAIGLDAFMYYDETVDEIVTNGFNLIITTTTKKMPIGGKSVDMPQYQLDFARRSSSITELGNIDLTSTAGIKYFNSLNSDVLHFDRDFYIKSTDAELEEFKLNYITAESAVATEATISRPPVKPPVKAKPVVEAVETEDESEEEDAIPMKNFKSPAKPVSDNLPVTDSGDIDVDALLNGLD
jgi:hypothetical protein